MALAITQHTTAQWLSMFATAFRAITPVSSHTLPRRIPILERLRWRLRSQATLLPSVFVPIPSIIDSLWDGLLKAVPKKKTSHRRSRNRQMAGKALKDVTSLNTCSACGRPKRAHYLCPYCVQSIKQWLSNGFKTKEQVAEQKLLEAQKLNDQLIAIGKKPYPLPSSPKA